MFLVIIINEDGSTRYLQVDRAHIPLDQVKPGEFAYMIEPLGFVRP